MLDFFCLFGWLLFLLSQNTNTYYLGSDVCQKMVFHSASRTRGLQPFTSCGPEQLSCGPTQALEAHQWQGVLPTLKPGSSKLCPCHGCFFQSPTPLCPARGELSWKQVSVNFLHWCHFSLLSLPPFLLPPCPTHTPDCTMAGSCTHAATVEGGVGGGIGKASHYYCTSQATWPTLDWS